MSEEGLECANVQGNKCLDNALHRLLLLDGNETNLIEDKETSFRFDLLVKSLLMMKYNIRWCSRVGCPCHPETTVKKLLEKEGLVQFLKWNGVLELVEKLSLDEYENLTVFDMPSKELLQ